MDENENIEELEDSLDSIEIGIEADLEDITHPYSKCKHLGRLIWSLVDMYRSRAILRYILHADIKGFFEDLNREALTYATLLNAYHNGYDVDNSRYNGSTFYPICCAIAAKNIQLSEDIDRLMPENPGNHDSKALFAYTNIVRSLVKQDDKAIEQRFSNFKKECRGFLRYDHKITAIEGIVKKDTDLFNQGLESYLDSFDEMPIEEAAEMDPGDESIDIESLAFIQLAKTNKIPIRVKHGMIPEELQEPELTFPDGGYPKWPG